MNGSRKTNPSLPNLATADEVTKKTEIKRKAFSRLVDFLEHYGEKVLDKLLPEVAMKAGMNIVLRIENRSGSIIKTHPNYILCLEVSCQNDVGKRDFFFQSFFQWFPLQHSCSSHW